MHTDMLTLSFLPSQFINFIVFNGIFEALIPKLDRSKTFAPDGNLNPTATPKHSIQSTTTLEYTVFQCKC
ncbi:unnamed protein product [Brugia pahangi]|uniref:Ovule protein n=1 Tax=Brugia pahangi TaxID=6280 RepID=A0A0N4T935_BRUPA|nr:unnamed protein product [Brugia pahangi]VDN88642.1 unnamed protein product [Brugia pahangi]